MRARRVVRAAYSRASELRALRKPLDRLRRHPRMRALARRQVSLLLGPGSTWANVDGALRLLAEEPERRIVFGPWRGDTATELLYWVPFVRWAQRHFGLESARLVAVSRGDVAHWYAGACGAYAEQLDDVRDAFVFEPAPVLDLVDRYRSGRDAPRPLMKRSVHVRLAAAPDPVVADVPAVYMAAALGPTDAFPPSAANRAFAEGLIRALGASAPIVDLDVLDLPDAVSPLRDVPATRRLRAQHAIVAGARGLVAAWSGLPLLAALSGVPAIALRSRDGRVDEPDLDMALRAVSALGGSLAVLDAADVESLPTALGKPPGA